MKQDKEYRLATLRTQEMQGKYERQSRFVSAGSVLVMCAGVLLLFHAHEAAHENLWGFVGSSLIVAAQVWRERIGMLLGFYTGMANAEQAFAECLEVDFSEEEGGNDDE